MSNITSNQIANRTRYHQLLIKADNTGGAVDSANIGSPEVTFSGTPSSYGRASGIVPFDYAGGTVIVNVYIYSASANNQTLNYYLANHRNGSNTSTSWNIQSNQTTAGINLSANVMKKFTVYTIPAGTLQPGDYIALAMRPASAVTGSIFFSACLIEYTADS